MDRVKIAPAVVKANFICGEHPCSVKDDVARVQTYLDGLCADWN